jgi:hypothetical protein
VQTLEEIAMETRILSLVEPRFHRDFCEFVRGCAASDEFLAYLDSDATCQQAVELVLTQDVEALRGIVPALRPAKQRRKKRLPTKSKRRVFNADLLVADNSVLN